MADSCPICFLNGEFLPIERARISPLDRGFLFADSVYEVIPVYGGRLFRAAQHFRRLASSMQQLALHHDNDARDWQALCEQLVEHNGGGDLALYLQVSRGAERGRNHLIPRGLAPTVFAMLSPVTPPSAELLARGVAVTLLEDNRWGRCDIKSTALLANVLLRQRAEEAGAAEAILARDGWLTEASASSLFVVSGGVPVTPPNSPAILPGVTRDLIIELARRHGIEVREAQVPVDALRDAEEVWIASSMREVLPVTRIDQRSVGTGRPGPLWKELYELFQQYKRDCTGASDV